MPLFAPTRRRLLPLAAALLCAASCIHLVRSSLPARADGPPNVSLAPRGVRILQHGGYPELQVDGNPFFVHSAAFFYPCIPRNLWEQSLDRYRELGINTIELSILWNWHAPREGEFDFDGHTNPRRDLRALLQLIARKGFKLIARPGPTILKDWRNGGYPDWLLERPEYHMPLADRLEGRLPPDAVRNAVDAEDAARLWLANPVHMRFAKEWLEAVARELAPYRAQATLRLPADDSAPAAGSSTATSATPGTKRAADREISGPLLFVQVEEGLGSGLENSAGPEFWRYAQALCGFLAAAGVDAFCFIDPAEPRSAAAGSALQTSVAIMGQWHSSSTNARGTRENESGTAEPAEAEFQVASLATQPAFPPMMIEYDPAAFPPNPDALPDPDSSAAQSGGPLLHLLLADGLRGINWFPLQDSLTPAGFETPAANRHYRWGAALALSGASQRAAVQVARIGEWLRIWGSQLAASHRRADFGLVHPLAALPRENLARADVAQITKTTLQLERLAQYAGMSSELADPQFQPAEQLSRHALLLLPVYRPDDPAYLLSEQAQRGLDAYVRGGGVLVCFPARPAGAIFDAMAQAPAAAPEHLPAGSLSWNVGKGRLVVLTKDFYSWLSLSDDFDEGLTRFEAPFALSLLQAMLADAGVRQSVRRVISAPPVAELLATVLVSNQGTLPFGERSGGQGWLSVVNASRHDTAAGTLQVLLPSLSARSQKDSDEDWLTLPVSLPPRESLLLPLDFQLCLAAENAPPCPDRILSAGAELVRAERDGKAMLLTFYAPARATVRIRLAGRPGHCEVDGASADVQWHKESHELVVDLLRGASPRFLRELRVMLPYTPALPEQPKQEWRHPAPARFRYSPAGAVRLPIGRDFALLTNPPLFVFQKGSEGLIGVRAEDRGQAGGDVQVRATGQFNTSARMYVSGGEFRSLNLKLPATTVDKAAAEAPAADGLYHGTLQFSSGAESEDMPASFAIVPEKGAIGYSFDFDADGSDERVLENSSVRAIVSPAEGGRLIALVAKSSDTNLLSSMGALEDVFAFTPNSAGSRPEDARGRAGTFNRPYAATWAPGDAAPALRMNYDAPDVYPHGARIEKSLRLVDERRLTVEYRVALLAADARRLEEEQAGKIFAAPLPEHQVAQAFQILSSVPATESGARGAQFCWQTGNSATPAAAHCEAFVPGGPAIPLPPDVSRLEVRQARGPGVAIEWPGAASGTRLTLEPRARSMLLRLAFPPLDPGGAAAAYRIEFSVMEAP